MEFMGRHVILSRAEYNGMKSEIMSLNNKIDSVIKHCRDNEGASGLVYSKDVMKILLIPMEEAEPFE